jgi:hypothetical protein
MRLKQHILIILLGLVSIPAIVNGQLDIPDPPELLSVSVDAVNDNDNVIIEWLPSDSLDVEGYIIYQVIGGITETLDTVYGRLNLTYTNTNSSASINTETYRMAAFDTLEFKSMITGPHTTMRLIADFEQCAYELSLTWTPYQGWTDGVEEYRIYRKLIDGDFSLLGTTAGDQTMFIDESVQPNLQYCYYIEAVNSDDVVANSNLICAFTESFPAPEYINANYATVIDNSIELSFTIGPGGEVSDYKLLKSLNKNAGFYQIASFINSGQSTIKYTDTDVQVEDSKFYYKLVSVDPCGLTSAESNVASNIVLNVTGDGNLYLNHYLDWTPYEDYSGGVENYRIYRVFTEGTPVMLYNSNYTNTNYTDNIASYVKYLHDGNRYVSDKYCYIVEAVENDVQNQIGYQGLSKSNKACYYQKPLVWLPNVFNPGSYNDLNRTFKPVLSFVSNKAYEFIIFDRAGLEIYKTNDPTEGWDGVLGLKRAPDETYIYYIKYLDFDNKEYIHTGKFLLITQ